MKNKDRRVGFMTYYFMVGGLIGLLVSFLRLRHPGDDSWFWFTLITQTVLFSLFFYVGYLFLNKENQRASELGIVIQLLQLVTFAAWGWSYYFAGGIGLAFTYGLETQSVELIAGVSEFELELIPKRTPKQFGLNVFALIILTILLRIRKTYR
ncbi:hypothetical protein [Gilvibacter sediminis]|uniref:hypothetical protein n=1 Tax=Gilvibacter sediminis TaxID=379071 RepID=UPI0023505338|nr:hypothetical protein [Gilvibacter sediminis]MDC7998147.1 hypothetical protein [Gilvibacter sediminis]